MDIIFLHSAWWLIPGFILSAGLSLLLYYRDSSLSSLPRKLIIFLAVLRFLFIFTIIFLLTGPSLNIKNTTKEPPILLFAQDNSSSVLLNSDSVFYKNEYPGKVKSVKEELSNEFDLHYFQFGDSVTSNREIDFNDNVTNFSDLLFSVKSGYTGRNVAGMVLASDGLYNQGAQPLYKFRDLPYPVFTIALGDTTRQSDLLVDDLKYNKIAFLNNTFPVKLFYKAFKLKGEEISFKVLKNGEEIYSDKISIDSEKEIGTSDIRIKAEEKGLQTYKLKLSAVKGEISGENNTRLFSVNVIDNQQQIDILPAAPHPDVASLNRALKTNKNFSVKTWLPDQLPVDLSETDLLILHQLPSEDYKIPGIIETLNKRNLPAMIFMGPESDINAFNNMGLPLNVNIKQDATDNAIPSFNNSFNKFDVSRNFLNIINNLSPLLVDFADYRFNSDHNVIFRQKINDVRTDKPLISISGVENQKFSFISGTGIWRWRLSDFILNGSHKGFDEFFNNISQYLVTSSTEKQFNVSVKQIIRENEPVIFKAELYNDAFELTNKPSAKLYIKDSSGNRQSYDFNRSVNAYKLNPGSFKPGEYKWTAKVTFDNKDFEEKGSFIVEPVSLEGLKTQANHKLLQMISNNSGGEIIYPHDINKLTSVIAERNIDKSKISVSYENSVLLNLKWIFFILLALITTEWFIRKYSGGY